MRLVNRLSPAFALTAATIAFSTPAFATPLAYTYVDARAVAVKLDDVDARGLTLSGSLLLGEDFFLTAGGGLVDTDKFTAGGVRGSAESRTLSLGAGIRHNLATDLDITASAAVVNAHSKGKGGFSGSDSDTGFDLNAALRSAGLFVPELEVAGGVSYLRVFGEADTAVNGEVLYHFTPRIAAALGASLSSDATSVSLGLRVDLGSAP